MRTGLASPLLMNAALLPSTPLGRAMVVDGFLRSGLVHKRQIMYLLSDGEDGVATPPTFWEAVVFYGHGYGRP